MGTYKAAGNKNKSQLQALVFLTYQEVYVIASFGSAANMAITSVVGRTMVPKGIYPHLNSWNLLR